MKFLLLFLATTLLLLANEDNLQIAYAKEFAYLKAQKEMLQQRLQEVKSSNEKNINDAKSTLQKLQSSVLEKNRESEKLEEDLFQTQQNLQTLSDDDASIESVLTQAEATLKPYGVQVEKSKEHYSKTLGEIFVHSDKLTRVLSSLRSERGKFYALDGSEVDAELLKIGNVATYGIADTHSGALVPAGDGKLKLWNDPLGKTSAQNLKNEQNSAPLHIFIYENSSKEVENPQEKDLKYIIDSGGVVGWVIIVLGAFGVLLALLRFFFLLQADSKTDTLAKETIAKLLEGGVEKTLEFLKYKKGSTARLLKATIRNLDRDREHIEDIVAESILHESSRLDKFGSTIIVIAAVAPLLGLLGTVTGMIATFDIITEFGTGDPKLLSSGISIALVTTELGLVVAIPAIMIGNMLNGWAEKIKDHMEQSALHLINEYSKHR